MGRFSSDRAVQQYADESGDCTPVPVDLNGKSTDTEGTFGAQKKRLERRSLFGS